MSKLLIVEDDREIAMLERDYLELAGFETQVVDDGNQAAELARAAGFTESAVLTAAGAESCPLA